MKESPVNGDRPGYPSFGLPRPVPVMIGVSGVKDQAALDGPMIATRRVHLLKQNIYEKHLLHRSPPNE